MRLGRRELLVGGAAGAALLKAGPLAAQPAAEPSLPAEPLLASLPGRSRTSLDGRWSYILDPFDAAGRGANPRRAFWRNEIARVGGPLIEYDWDSSPTMTVPGDWNSQVEELQWYDGPAYFRRTFAAPEGSGRHYLAFEAINYRSTVWLNGEELGRHEGGFTPFEFEVTGKLKPGENSLVVRADSRHPPDGVPTAYTDWQNYGGITRSVWLVEVPATHLRHWFLRLEDGRLVADVQLHGPEASGTEVELALPELQLSLRGRTDASGSVRLSAPVPRRLQRWTPEQPRLYRLTLSAGADRQEERVGFRTLAARGRELLLNGRPLFLRGISLHEEPFGPEGTRSMTEAGARALLTEAKALGCNFVRLAHYPHSEVTMRLADELGLLVWAEVPVYWEDIRYDSPRTLGLAKAMLSDMIVRDRNRAAVAFWSVANETPITPARNAFLRELIATARSLDPTRLITAALNKNVDVGGATEGQSRFRVEDPLGADLDVLAVNQYEGWYGPRTPAQIAQVSFESAYDKPLMFSEFGADALLGERGPRERRWTEEYQAWLYEETLRLVDRTPGCVGLSPWLLKDFRSPRRWHGRFQQYWNRKGLVDPEGRRKQAWHVLHSYYRRRIR